MISNEIDSFKGFNYSHFINDNNNFSLTKWNYSN